jgi:hypothetical protein
MLALDRGGHIQLPPVNETDDSPLVRIVGQAPLYRLQRLRCNTCGDIFTAEAPESVGSEQYDATSTDGSADEVRQRVSVSSPISGRALWEVNPLGRKTRNRSCALGTDHWGSLSGLTLEKRRSVYHYPVPTRHIGQTDPKEILTKPA